MGGLKESPSRVQLPLAAVDVARGSHGAPGCDTAVWATSPCCPGVLRTQHLSGADGGQRGWGWAGRHAPPAPCLPCPPRVLSAAANGATPLTRTQPPKNPKDPAKGGPHSPAGFIPAPEEPAGHGGGRRFAARGRGVRQEERTDRTRPSVCLQKQLQPGASPRGV